MDPTYEDENKKAQAARPEFKQAVFVQESRAREPALRVLFDLAMESDRIEREAREAVPDPGYGPEDLVRYTAAADHHYFDTFYAPEVYAEALFLAIYGVNSGFATTVLGYTEPEARRLAAGDVALNGRTFFEIVCAIRDHIMHYHDQAQILDFTKLTPKKPAYQPISVFRDLGFQLPLDMLLAFDVLEKISDRDFDKLMKLQNSVGPSMIATKHPGFTWPP